MWDIKKLNTVCDVIAGQSPESTFYNKDGNGKPFFQGKADFNDDYPTVRYYTTKTTKTAIVNDILLSVRAPVGPTNICDIEACIGRGLAAIRPKSDVNYKYIYFYFKYIEKKLSLTGNGSTFSAITTNDVKNINIPVPPISIQKLLAEILDKADALHKKDKQLLKYYDDLTQSLFIDMFGNYSNVVKLNTVCSKITDGVHAKPNYTENGVPFLSVKNATDRFLNFSNCKYISELDHKAYTKRCKPEFDDILYTKVGATYGRAALITNSQEFSIYVSLALIKPLKELVSSEYLTFVMNSQYVKKQADRRVKGAGVPDLHLVEIKDFDIILPPLPLQKEFTGIIKNIEQQKNKIKYQLQESENLFQTLLQQAFDGSLK